MKKIALIDSGKGGVSILRKLYIAFPSLHFFYFCDNLYFPYGEKTKEEIIERVQKICDYLLDNDIDMIIIACNSASSVTLNLLKRKLSIPVIGVIEPCATRAVLTTIKNKITLIGTELTVNSKMYEQLISLVNESIEVKSIVCTKLVQAIEYDYDNKVIIKNVLKECLKDLDKNSDVLILGCTHFSIISKEIRKYLGEDFNIIDSSVEIKNMLKGNIIIEESKGKIDFLYSGELEKINSFVSEYLEVEEINYMRVEI